MINIKGKEIELNIKGGFSERKGIKNFSDEIQVKSLNDRTRNRIYTATNDIFDLFKQNRNYANYFVEKLYIDIFSKTKNDIPKSAYR